MSFPYRHVLMVGATSGIGHAMAERLIEQGCHVTVVGRRQDRLGKFVEKHGKDKASSAAFDISKIEEIPKFAKDVTTAHPELDCVFLNAGVQTTMDFNQPEKVDMSKFASEMNLNFISFAAMTQAFLPFLMKKNSSTSLIYTTSNLAIIPAPGVPAYSASKAALNAFVICLREQLQSPHVKIIELLPPAVQTELHDYMGEEKGRQVGMPLKEFVDHAWEGLATGKDEIVVKQPGMGDVVNDILAKKRAGAAHLAKAMRQRDH